MTEFDEIYNNCNKNKENVSDIKIRCMVCKKKLKHFDLCWNDSCELQSTCSFSFDCNKAVCFGCRNEVMHEI